MEMSDERLLPAEREVVWALLNDPDVLRDCIPGCESLEAEGPDAFTGAVRVKLGPVKARFTGKVTLTDLDFPASYALVGEGQGGLAGFVKGRADIELSEAEVEATLLRYHVQVQIGGKLAQLGNRLIDSTSRRLAEQFFERFAERVAAVSDPSTA